MSSGVVISLALVRCNLHGAHDGSGLHSTGEALSRLHGYLHLLLPYDCSFHSSYHKAGLPIDGTAALLVLSINLVHVALCTPSSNRSSCILGSCRTRRHTHLLIWRCQSTCTASVIFGYKYVHLLLLQAPVTATSSHSVALVVLPSN